MSAQPFPETSFAWHLRIFNLSWPIILSNLSVPLVGIVDTAVVGQLPDPVFIAAVGMGAAVFSSLFWVFGFLRMGTTGFVAQGFGAGQRVFIRLTLWRALLIALGLSVLVLLLQWPLRLLTFTLMGAEESVTIQAALYFDIRIWSAPATFINYVVLGCLLGLQRMYAALLTQWVLNVTNMLLDVIFVLWLDMAVAGVAWATVISEYLTACLGLYLLRNFLYGRRMPWAQLRDAKALKKMFAVNRDLFIRTLCLTSAFFFFTAQSAQFGAAVMAANAILLHLLHVIAYGLDGFAHAAEILVGSAYGARRKDAFKQTLRVSTLWALISALCFSVVYALLGMKVIGLMSVNAAIVDLAGGYLIWLVCAPLVAVWSYQMDGVFIGMTETSAMRNTVLLATGIYVLLVWLVVPVWGNHALWVCLLIFLLLRGIFLFCYLPGLLPRFAADP